MHLLIREYLNIYIKLLHVENDYMGRIRHKILNYNNFNFNIVSKRTILLLDVKNYRPQCFFSFFTKSFYIRCFRNVSLILLNQSRKICHLYKPPQIVCP